MTAAFVPFPRAALDRSIPDRLAEQVIRNADRIAVRDRRQTLTYRELGIAVDCIAHRILLHRGPAPEPVAILLDQNTMLVQAALGVLSAGKFYVPFDPAHPRARLKAMLEDARAALILTDADHMSQAVALIGNSEQVINLSVTETASTASFQRPVVGPDELAYVYYTSGSTGQPKGVMDSHRNVLHNVMRYTNSLRVIADDRFTQLHSPGNSGAVSDIFGALLVGAELVQFDLRQEDLVGLAAWIECERPTVFHSAPAVFRNMATSAGTFSSLRLIRLEGDQATPHDVDLYRNWCAPGCVLVNGLGLTECGLVRQYFVNQATPIGTFVPVGYPIEDMTVLVIDTAGREVPAGEIGEIVIESPFLALGYWQRPDLTADRFSTAPDRPGVRRYRTGDLGRLRADGCLEYHGRTDFQPKVRGYRIDIAEIEAALLEFKSVREAAVMVRGDGHDEPRLVAYCIASSSPPPTSSALRQHLAERLPRDLLPSAYVWLEQMPLTDNDKLDRRALPPPGSARPRLDTAFAAPKTVIEEELTRLWADVLQLDEIGVNDNFFDLGGDSLQGMQLIALIRSHLNVGLGVHTLFESPTVTALGSVIDTLKATSPVLPMQVAIPRRDVSGLFPLSFAQEQILLVSQFDPDVPISNVPLAMRLVGPLDLEALEQAFAGVVERHDALRTTFQKIDDVMGQQVEADCCIDIDLIDMMAVAADVREAHLHSRLHEEARRPFDLSRLPLLRVHLFRLAEAEHVLLCVLHHIVSDGWSESVLFSELTARYEAAARGQSLQLPALPIRYADYVAWQRERLCGALGETQLAYWRSKLEGAPPYLDLAQGRASRSIMTVDGARESIDLPQPLINTLSRIAQRAGATLFMALLAAFKALLQRYTGCDDIVVATAISGRTETETQMLVGCFINTLALRTDISGDPPFLKLLGRVRKTSLEAYAHQDLPYSALVAELGPERRAGRVPVAQISFVFEPPIPPFAPTLLKNERLEVTPGTSVYDLSLFVEPGTTGLRATAEFRTQLFDVEMIRRMLRHWLTLLEGAAADPEQRVSELSLLTATERRQLLEEWNSTAVAYPDRVCIHQLFEIQVARAPEAVAVVFGEQRLTYTELNTRANRLAHHLRMLGVGPEVPVAIALDRSLELVVGLLGILKAGGAYVPLDPGYPAERLAFMLADTQAPVLLTQERLLENLPVHAGRTVCLDRDWAHVAEQPDTDPSGVATSENLAYVIYTSGSTGQPKGVMVEHRALVNHMEWMCQTFQFDVDDFLF
jgi:amino acid adenylation domain-containing protein